MFQNFKNYTFLKIFIYIKFEILMHDCNEHLIILDNLPKFLYSKFVLVN